MGYNNAMRALGVLGCLIGLLVWGCSQPTVRAVRLDGVSVMPIAELEAPLRSLIGTAPTESQIRDAFKQIENLYHKRGYILARVTDYTLTEDGTLTVTLTEGRIEKIEITGNRRTRAYMLRKLIGIREGEVYNERRIQRIRQNLGRFEFLREAKLGSEPGTTLGTAVLLLNVQEERSFDFSIAAGYTSEEGFVGYADLIETNVGGLGHRARIQFQRELRRDPLTGEQSALRPSYAFQYEAPRFLPGDFNFGFEVYDRNPFYPLFFVDVNHLRRYERRQGISAYIGLDWRDLFEIRLRYRNDFVSFDEAPTELIDPSSRLNNRGRFQALGLQLIYDTRRGLSLVESGFFGTLWAEQTLTGGDFRFMRVGGEARYYLPLPYQHQLVLRGVAGVGSDRLPLSEQFWIGGYDLLRGYSQDAHHGTRMAAGSVEYRFPVLEGVQAGVFVDAGSVWNAGQERRARLLWGAGAGLRFATPIGIIKLDAAYGQRGFVYLSLVSP